MQTIPRDELSIRYVCQERGEYVNVTSELRGRSFTPQMVTMGFTMFGCELHRPLNATIDSILSASCVILATGTRQLATIEAPAISLVTLSSPCFVYSDPCFDLKPLVKQANSWNWRERMN